MRSATLEVRVNAHILLTWREFLVDGHVGLALQLTRTLDAVADVDCVLADWNHGFGS